MIFALAGNQNCGKTTLFNQLTGSNQHVGNFPGVTVDQKSGPVRGQKDCTVVDLPGIYSLRPYTAEEIVTRDFILKNKPDGIINIVDATNLERNLYLTLQLLTLRVPTVLALNMMDELTGNGGSIDTDKLSQQLGVPVVPICAASGDGVEALIEAAVRTAEDKRLPAVVDFCAPGPVHRCIHAVCHQIEDHAQRAGLSVRFAATWVIDGDEAVLEQLRLDQNEKELIEHSIVQMELERGLDRNAAIADMRYTFIEALVKACVVKPHESKERLRSVSADKILTGKYTAIPIFIGVMLLIFYLTFHVIGQGLSDLLASGIDALTVVVDRALTAYHLNPVVQSLVIDGIFQGVGAVLSFLPIIVTLFFFLSILEDTGYMARVAFVMDKLLRRIGLSGKSVVPMLIGFGCTVPAVMAARTLPSERDRTMTILLTPFMSCSAKIPIYAFFSAAFFPKYAALVMIGLYVLGILFGILSALVLKSAFRGRPVPFVMELPNYRLPSVKSVALLLWDKAKDFIERAFTVIFLATIVIWFLQSFDTRLDVVTSSEQSLLAMVGRWLAPIFAPLGFADWRCATALITGFIAKESVVSTLQILLGTAAISTLYREGRAELSGLYASVYPVRCGYRRHPARDGFGAASRTHCAFPVLHCVAGRVRSVPSDAAALKTETAARPGGSFFTWRMYRHSELRIEALKNRNASGGLAGQQILLRADRPVDLLRAPDADARAQAVAAAVFKLVRDKVRDRQEVQKQIARDEPLVPRQARLVLLKIHRKLPAADFGAELFHVDERERVKRLDAELALIAVQPLADCLGQRHMVAARGLKLDDERRFVLEQGKNLVKGRDLLVRALKPELLQLVQRQILDLALDIRAALQIRVMEDGKRAVIQKMHVQLRAEAALDGPAEGGQRVFRDDGLVVIAPVGVTVLLENLPLPVSLPAPQRQRKQQIERQKHDQDDADCQHSYRLLSCYI